MSCSFLLQRSLSPLWARPTFLLASSTRHLTISTPHLSSLKLNRRDQHRRLCVANHHKERLPLQAIIRNKLLPEVVQNKARADIANQPRDASITRVRKRCVSTGRARGVVTEYKLCRMKFRELADHGLISGLTRSSW